MADLDQSISIRNSKMIRSEQINEFADFQSNNASNNIRCVYTFNLIQ